MTSRTAFVALAGALVVAQSARADDAATPPRDYVAVDAAGDQRGFNAAYDVLAARLSVTQAPSAFTGRLELAGPVAAARYQVTVELPGLCADAASFGQLEETVALQLRLARDGRVTSSGSFPTCDPEQVAAGNESAGVRVIDGLGHVDGRSVVWSFTDDQLPFVVDDAQLWEALTGSVQGLVRTRDSVTTPATWTVADGRPAPTG